MSWAIPYIGIPDKPKGRDFDGADCWGLVMLAYRGELGVELPDYSDQYDAGRDSKIIADLADREKARLWRNVDDPQPLDLLSFAVGHESHAGLWVAPGQMLHTLDQSRIDQYDAPRWASRLIGFYRYAG